MSRQAQLLHVVVPLYDEEAILPALHDRLETVLEELGCDWRVTYVDDGSRDDTPALLEEVCRSDRRVSALHLSRNFGQQLAIGAGLEVASGDAVVLMDGDLQDPPEVIPRLLEKWEDGYDVVYAVKKERKEGLLKRGMFALFYALLRRLSPLEMPADAGNFSLMDRSVVDLINAMPERHRYVSGLRAYVGGRQTGIEFERDERYAGRPRQSPLRLVRMATDAFFAFSELPLRLATFLGFGIAGVSFAVLLNVLYKRLVTGEAILGWASVMTSILLLGGIQLIAIGVIGEYVGRVYNEVKGRPPWIVGRSRNLPAGESAPTGDIAISGEEEVASSRTAAVRSA